MNNISEVAKLYKKWLNRDYWSKPPAMKGPERNRLKKKFKYSVIIYTDYVSSWYYLWYLWQTYGPKDGRCTFSDDLLMHDVFDNRDEKWFNVPCPIHQEYINEKLNEISLVERKNQYPDFELLEELEECPEHYHEGQWSSVWLFKYGYDMGYEEFYFSTSDQLGHFLSILSTYPKLKIRKVNNEKH